MVRPVRPVVGRGFRRLGEAPFFLMSSGGRAEGGGERGSRRFERTAPLGELSGLEKRGLEKRREEEKRFQVIREGLPSLGVFRPVLSARGARGGGRGSR